MWEFIRSRLLCELYRKNSASFIEAMALFFASGICRSYRLPDQDGILFRLHCRNTRSVRNDL